MLKVNEKCNCLKVNCYLLGIFGYKVGDLQLSETIFIVQSEKSPSSDGSESRLDSDSAFFGRLVLDFAGRVKTQTRSGSTFQDSDWLGLKKVSLVMGLSEDSASTRLWLGIFWLTRTRLCSKSQDSDSIRLDFLRLGLART